MKTAPDDIEPHPNLQSSPEVAPSPDIPETRPEPGLPGVTPNPLPEIEPASPGGAQIDQPGTTPEVTPIEPAEIQPAP